MSKLQNISALIEILGLDDETQIEKTDSLDNFDWDSMAVVMLQTHIDSEFNTQIDPDNIPKFSCIGEIDDYIESFK